jgi:hypothetical protein
MGLEIGGYTQATDWPKLGPSLVIASSLILAVRTAKWPPRENDSKLSDRDLEIEVDNAIYLAGRVLSALVTRQETLFPQVKKPWFMPDGEDVPK